jgi:asparagine synthase (glutamine-hydrolysing)
MAKHVRPLHTFAVGTPGSEDLEAARVVARHIGSTHHEYVLDPDEIRRDLGTILYHLESFDRALVRSAIPCFYGARLASDHVKVVLTGEGADELFAGNGHGKGNSNNGNSGGNGGGNGGGIGGGIGGGRNPNGTQTELSRSVAALHGFHLQRVDRMTTAHGVEGRVPFLDLDLVHLAQTITPDLKRRRQANGPVVDKWLLRAVVEDLLPAEALWRAGAGFDRGSGTLDVLEPVLRELEGEAFRLDDDAPSARPTLRSREEWVYYRLIVESYGEAAQSIAENAGRWDGPATYA